MVVQPHQSQQYAIDPDRLCLDHEAQSLALLRSEVVSQDWYQTSVAVGAAVTGTLLYQKSNTSHSVKRNRCCHATVTRRQPGTIFGQFKK